MKESVPALREVLQVLKANYLTTKPVKTEVAKTLLVFLGHTIQEGCISSDENNVSKVLPIRQPQTKRQIRQIIGLVNYYHDFALNYSQLMSPLTELLKGGPIQRKII